MEVTAELLLWIIRISVGGILLILFLLLMNYLYEKYYSETTINTQSFLSNLKAIIGGIYKDIKNYIDNILTRFPKGDDDESISFLTAVAYGIYTIVGWFLTIIFLIGLGVGGAYLAMNRWEIFNSADSIYEQLPALLIGLLGAIIALVCITALLSILLAIVYKWLVDIRIRGNKQLVDTNKALIRVLDGKFGEDEAGKIEDLNADSPDKTEGKKDKIKYTPHGDEKEVELAEDHSDELYEITLDPETNKPSKIEKI